MPGHDLLRTVDSLMGPAPCGVCVVQAPCRLVWANAAFFRTTGRAESLVGKDLTEVEGLRDGPVVAAIVKSLKARTPAALRDVPLTSKGLHRYAHVDIWPLLEEEGHPSMVVATFSDETEKVSDRERARLFYEAFLTSTNAMELTDPTGTLVDVNPAFERTYGYSRSECLGKKPNLVRSRKTPIVVYERMWKDLTNPELGHWSGEILNRDRKGNERPVFLTITAIRDEDGKVTHYLGVAVDLTVQKAWERGAAHAERLASLGRLAAGVAHEINTPLANVLLVAESIRRRNPDPWLDSRLTSITAQVEVAAKIVRNLLEFSRRSEPHIQDLDLSRVVKDAVEFLRGKQSAEVELDERYPDAPVPISGDRGQLVQVLTNLLNNAYEAIEGVGKISIEVREDHGMGVVEVADSGKGIAPDALPHIFEPFFTTKEEGKGTGLGLAICHGIVQGHQGTITGHNAPRGGAVFTVRLPLRVSLPPQSAEGMSPAG